MIGVVIPYFQRTPGLLARALRSIEAQAGAETLQVFVVDDGSPAPAAPELIGLPEALRRRILVLRQPNAGPGAARNRALDAMPAEIDTVAFLDSDDVWTPGHLRRARAALARGAGFYFADHRRETERESRFRQCGFLTEPSRDRLRPLPAEEVFRSIVERSPVGTSTVVVRRSVIGDVRFPRALRTAGEDSLFWLELLRRGARPACSLEIDANYGRGVSIFDHRSWGDARSLRTTLDEMRAQQAFRSRFDLGPDLSAASDAQCNRLDAAFCAGLVACLRRGRWDGLQPAALYFRDRPRALLRLPHAGLQALRQLARHLVGPLPRAAAQGPGEGSTQDRS